MHGSEPSSRRFRAAFHLAAALTRGAPVGSGSPLVPAPGSQQLFFPFFKL